MYMSAQSTSAQLAVLATEKTGGMERAERSRSTERIESRGPLNIATHRPEPMQPIAITAASGGCVTAIAPHAAAMAPKPQYMGSTVGASGALNAANC